VPRTPNFYAGFASGGFTGTTHSGVWDYLQEVPLVLYGPGFIKSQGEIGLNRPVTVGDLAPTQAELLHKALGPETSGTPLTEALVPGSRRSRRPKLVVTVVWDGGGWNVLRRWPNSWPFLRKLMDRGTSVVGATVGSSPSVTAAVHATIGTGTVPNHHGIVDSQMRVKGHVSESWRYGPPDDLMVPTLADLYDRQTDNRAKVGMVAYRRWHLGMIGHGSFLRGGDRDVAVMFRRDSRLLSPPKWYSMPPYLREVRGWRRDTALVDTADGQLDSRWRNHDVIGDRRDLLDSPAWLLYQTRIIKALVQNEHFGRDRVGDLLYTNYKQIDLLGHTYNMLNVEVADALRYSDLALKRLVGFLDGEIGRENWVLAFTADHGQQPNARSVRGWPISTSELESDLGSRFEGTDGVVEKWRPSGVWLDRKRMRQSGLTPEDMSSFLSGYTVEDNASKGEDIPPSYESRADDRVFAAVFPGDWMSEVSRCVRRRV
jgi:hypothetical protein